MFFMYSDAKMTLALDEKHSPFFIFLFPGDLVFFATQMMMNRRYISAVRAYIQFSPADILKATWNRHKSIICASVHVPTHIWLYASSFCLHTSEIRYSDYPQYCSRCDTRQTTKISCFLVSELNNNSLTQQYCKYVRRARCLCSWCAQPPR
jgi:hypothetical protein